MTKTGRGEAAARKNELEEFVAKCEPPMAVENTGESVPSLLFNAQAGRDEYREKSGPRVEYEETDPFVTNVTWRTDGGLFKLWLYSSYQTQTTGQFLPKATKPQSMNVGGSFGCS